MRKDVRDTVKELQGFANPPCSFRVEQNNHLKVTWNMFDNKGNPMKIVCVLGVSPSDNQWKMRHNKNLRRIFRERNIPYDDLNI